MDLLNKTFVRLSDWHRSLTPGARVAVGVLLVICAASAALLFNQQAAGSKAYLFGGEAVAASQLPGMVQALATAGLADYELQDNRIRVPQGKQAVYMGALASAGALPNNFGDSLRRMLDRSSSPWIGKRQQEEMSKIALQDELTKIIDSMPGIETASVLYNVETEQGLHTRKQITASVNVKPAGNQLLSLRQVEMIRHVVGPPIGIDPRSVAIVDFNGATYPASLESDGEAGADRRVKAKLDYERKYMEKIREALGFIPSAAVTVNVELPPELDAPELATQNDMRATANEEKKAATVNEPASIKSLIEAVASAPASSQTPAGKQERNTTADSQKIAKVSLTPRRVTVTVGIPSSYYEDVWRQRHAASADSKPSQFDAEALRQIEAEVNATIKHQVVQAVPWPEGAGADRAQLVTISAFQEGVAWGAEHRVAEHRATWWDEHGTTVSLSIAALASLAALRWIVRSSASSAATNTTLRLADETMNEFDEGLTRRQTVGRFRGATGPSLREELAGIVHDDPDSAASVLRNWIGSAG